MNDTQKAQIEMVLGAGSRVALSLSALATIWLLFPMGSSALLDIPSDWNDRLLVFVLFCLLVVPVLTNLYLCFALRTTLKDSPRATEQITLAERLDAQAAVFSVALLKTCFVLLLSWFLFAAYLVLAERDALSFFGLVLSGWFVIWTAALLRVKLRSSGRI